ncbi:MAG: hypothetical protein K5899_01040 [Bacteroidaceae bacterium]|nr:hypothetical protein [Bacteroidaceae bacterium]
MDYNNLIVEWKGKVQYEKEPGIKGLVPNCEILLRDGEKLSANSYLCTLVGDAALKSYLKGDLVNAHLIFGVYMKDGQYHQGVWVSDIKNLTFNDLESYSINE